MAQSQTYSDNLFNRAAGLLDDFLANRIVKRLAAILPKPVKIMFVLKKSYEREDYDAGIGRIAEDLFEKVQLLGDFIQAYVRGDYRDIEPYKIALTLACIAYFVSPFDLIPDAIPVIGLMDDIFLMSWLIRNLDRELEKFRKWQESVPA